MRRRPPNVAALNKLLNRLAAQPGVAGGLVATPDGLPVATCVQDRDTAESWAAVGAVLANAACRLLQSCERGELQQATFQAEDRAVLVCPVSLGFLIAVAEPHSDGEALWSGVHAAATEVERVAAGLVGRGGE